MNEIGTCWISLCGLIAATGPSRVCRFLINRKWICEKFVIRSILALTFFIVFAHPSRLRHLKRILLSSESIMWILDIITRLEALPCVPPGTPTRKTFFHITSRSGLLAGESTARLTLERYCSLSFRSFKCLNISIETHMGIRMKVYRKISENFLRILILSWLRAYFLSRWQQHLLDNKTWFLHFEVSELTQVATGTRTGIISLPWRYGGLSPLQEERLG